jgi:hypothetical protein
LCTRRYKIDNIEINTDEPDRIPNRTNSSHLYRKLKSTGTGWGMRRGKKSVFSRPDGEVTEPNNPQGGGLELSFCLLSLHRGLAQVSVLIAQDAVFLFP